ncbi:LysR family transcriptional regulator [Actibacterium pelagium]|uniref:LysR family transcriptional regulator n=1 Tax=Actibacterium pelagium TaxID=2029103 RepID=A0A917AAW9_9RHOB|nr:LysR family transcriptional regulator [Actibacterium pelagium]GGE39064.1 LysR family transcriptional regulator [Actibacterium pelagium]
MNWQSIRFDWNQVRAFLVTAEEGTLSAAARALGLTQPTLGRQVTALEEELGVALFERDGRSLILTPAGLELLEHVRVMGEAAQQVSLSATGQSQSIAGPVRVSAGDAMSAYVLPKIIDDLHRKAPAVRIELIASNQISDLRRREADIAIRHVRPTDPALYARLIRESDAHLYASPDYVRRGPMPKSLTDPGQARFIGMDPLARMIDFFRQNGLMVEDRNFAFLTDSSVAAWEMARQGLGICVMGEEIASVTPGMVRVLPDFLPIRVQMWLTTHRELHTSRRIRLVFDHLAEALGGKIG